MNPNKREYTFYSHNHISHSTIDYFVISKDLVESVIDSTIGVIAFTDQGELHIHDGAIDCPRICFKQYNKMIRDFLWNGKKSRIKLEKLYTTRNKGGLALPNVELYRTAFEVFKIAEHWGGESSARS